MTDIERIELAIRRVLSTGGVASWRQDLQALADELAHMRRCDNSAHPETVPEPGYKLKWVP